MTQWGRNCLLLIHLAIKNCWLIGSANLRRKAAVGMNADVGFLAIAEKAGHAMNAIFSD